MVFWQLDNFADDLFASFVIGLLTWITVQIKRSRPSTNYRGFKTTPIRPLLGIALAYALAGASTVSAFWVVRHLYGMQPMSPSFPTSHVELLLELALTFASGVGTGFGASYGIRKRLTEIPKGDLGGRFFSWIGPPVFAAYGFAAFAGIAIAVLLLIWNAPEEWRKSNRDQPEVERFNQMIRSGQLQKDFDRIIQQKLQKRAEGQDVQRDKDGKLSKEPEGGTAH